MRDVPMDEEALRQMINSIDVEMPTGGDGPSILESITKEKPVAKKRVSKKLFVQKITTDIYVGTDSVGKSVTEVIDQKLYIFGEMTENKFRKLVEAEKALNDQEEG